MTDQIRVNIKPAQRLLSLFNRRYRNAAQRALGDDLKESYRIAFYWAPFLTRYLRNNIETVQRGLRGRLISKAPYSRTVVGKRYARGPHAGQAIEFMNRATKDSPSRQSKAFKRYFDRIR